MWKCKCGQNNLLINGQCSTCGSMMPSALRTKIYRSELYAVKFARYRQTVSLLKAKLSAGSKRASVMASGSQKTLSGITKLFLLFSEKCLIPITAFVLIFTVVFSVYNQPKDSTNIVSATALKITGVKNIISTQLKPNATKSTQKLSLTVKQTKSRINPNLQNNLKQKSVTVLQNAVNIKTALPLHLKNTIEELKKK